MATLTLLVGIPCSGKSAYAKTKIDRKVRILTTDMVRKELFGYDDDPKHNETVLKSLFEKARKLLEDGRDVLIDEPCCTKQDRQKILENFNDLNIRRKAIIIDTPVEICLKRNNERRNSINNEIINEAAKNFEFPQKDENFNEIVVIKTTKDGFMKYLQTTLLLIIKDGKVLLAKKKRGFGAGLYNGAGGKVNAHETVEEAMLREAKEELNIVPINYKKRAEINFDEYVKDERALVNMHIYVAENYEGSPEETEEMQPVWFETSKIPFSRMFPDDSYWLPEILKGNNVTGFFKYDINLNTLEHEVNVTTENFN